MTKQNPCVTFFEHDALYGITYQIDVLSDFRNGNKKWHITDLWYFYRLGKKI